MATQYTGWKCTHTASITSQTDTTATIKVICYWKNDGWTYNVNGITAYTYCNGTEQKVLDKGNVDTSSSSGYSTTSSKAIGSYSYTINKTTSAQSISCYAKIDSDSSYAGDYTRSSTATTISVSPKTSYAVTYNANGGSGAPSNQTKWHGTTLILSSTTPTRAGYTFKGWGTSTTDTTADYAAGANYTSNAAITLYAIWTANTYTVTFNTNGGAGGPTTQTKTHGVDLTLSSTKPTRTNYNFLGWGTSAGTATVSYAPGAKYTANANITLYAVWSLAYVKPRISNFSAIRCDSSGNANNNGTYAKVAFTWATDKTVSEVKVYIKASNTSTWSSSTLNATGTSGTISKVISGFSVDSSYSVYVTVADSGGTTQSATLTVSSQIFPIDALAGGNGVAFGKTAERDGYLESNFNALFNKEVKILNGWRSHYAGSGGGSTGYIKFARLNIMGTYVNDVVEIEVVRRAQPRRTTLAILFVNQNGTDPSVDKFLKMGHTAVDYYMVKVAAGIWELYAPKAEAWDGMTFLLPIHGRSISGGGIKVEWLDEYASSVPSGYIAATNGGYLPYAGGTLSGNVTMQNNIQIHALTASGTSLNMLTLNSYDNAIFGYGSYDLGIGGTILYGNSTVSLRSKGNVNFQNPNGILYFTTDRFRSEGNDKFYLGDSSNKWKSVFAVTGTIQTSDRNKKEDINPLDSKYEQLFNKLKPVSYKLKNTDGENHDRIHTGFISQDIEEAMTECDLTALDFAGFCKDIAHKTETDEEGNVISTIDILDENGDPVYEYSLRYEEFIALNTHMIQKQQKEIESLQNEVAELKNLVQQLLGKE